MTYVTFVLYVLPIWCFTILRIPWPPHVFQILQGHVAMDAIEILPHHKIGPICGP